MKCKKDCRKCSQLNVRTDDKGCSYGYDCLKYGDSVFEEDNVVTVCYGKEETWTSREDAEEHFLNCILRTDAGSERDRYVNILCKLKYGECYCTDSNEI